jgi:hypothetical protein
MRTGDEEKKMKKKMGAQEEGKRPSKRKGEECEKVGEEDAEDVQEGVGSVGGSPGCEEWVSLEDSCFEWTVVRGEEEADEVAEESKKQDQNGLEEEQPAQVWPLPCGEQRVVLWEDSLLRSLGTAMHAFGQKEITEFSTQQMLKIGGGAVGAAVALPVSLLAMAANIDNPWTLACEKSKEAGELLANSIACGYYGARPVTLVGFSLGARVIYYALKALAARKRRSVEREQTQRQEQQRKCQGIQEGCEAEELNTGGVATEEQAAADGHDHGDIAGAAGVDADAGSEDAEDEARYPDPSTLVENVVLLGSPVGCNVAKWAEIKTVVSGRLVNGYCGSDGVLKFLYRYNRWELNIAGLVEVPGMENVDLSSIVNHHLDYAEKIPEIMRKLDLEHTSQPHAGSC